MFIQEHIATLRRILQEKIAVRPETVTETVVRMEALALSWPSLFIAIYQHCLDKRIILSMSGGEDHLVSTIEISANRPHPITVPSRQHAVYREADGWTHIDRLVVDKESIHTPLNLPHTGKRRMI